MPVVHGLKTSVAPEAVFRKVLWGREVQAFFWRLDELTNKRVQWALRFFRSQSPRSNWAKYDKNSHVYFNFSRFLTILPKNRFSFCKFSWNKIHENFARFQKILKNIRRLLNLVKFSMEKSHCKLSFAQNFAKFIFLNLLKTVQKKI